MAGELPIWVDGDWYTITTRHTNSGTPIQKTMHYVGQHMGNDLGINVEYHVWKNDTNPNVIGEIPGLVNPDDIFIIGAHIDDVNGTKGVDDNASGSVATLLAADILSHYHWGWYHFPKRDIQHSFPGRFPYVDPHNAWFSGLVFRYLYAE